MNYKPVVAGNQSNCNACTKASDDACKARVETVLGTDYILLPLWTQDPSFSQSSKDSPNAGFKPSGEEEKKYTEEPGKEGGNPTEEGERVNQEKDATVNSTNNINTVSPTVNATSINDCIVDENIVYGCADDPNMSELEDIVYSDDDEDVGAEADMNNLDAFMHVSPIPTTRIHKDHPVEQIIRDLNSTPQTRRMTKNLEEHEAMQEELLQFKLQEVWTLVELPNGKRVIGTKWVFKNEKDKRDGCQECFSLWKIEEEVYVCQPPGFQDPDFLDRVYKVEKTLYGLYQAPRAWYKTLSTYLLDNGFQKGKIDKTLFIRWDKGDILLVQVYVDDIIFGSIKKSLCTEFEKMMHKKFQMSSMGELTFFLGLQVKQKEDGIFISQDKYMIEIFKKFGFSGVKTANTPMETHKPLLKDADGEDVDEHLYRSMIRSLMYLTSSRPDIMFAICACVRFQVNPKVSHLHAVKRIFRYLKGQPKLGLWYHKDSPFDLVAFTDSDYAGASLDRKSTTGGCQFLRCRLISCQCKKQTVTKIHIDNESTICIVKNPIFHSKIKHIEIRYHFIRDSNEKKLIQMIKIHTDQNVAYLLTKAFDVSRFQYRIAITTAGEVVTTASATTTVDELTLAQTLIEIKAAKPKAVITIATTITIAIASTRPKAKGIVFHDQEEQAPAFTPIVSSSQASQIPQAKDKGKAKMVEPEKPLKKKDQIALDEELALRLHAEEQAELERMQKERVAQEEASRAAIIEELDSIQAMIKADEQLAARLQAKEQE
ncbi:putative ribonuclease H-like domain-containing protein [Tanacetum coccineum]